MSYASWQFPGSNRRWRIYTPDGHFLWYVVMSGLEVELFKVTIACVVDYGFHTIQLA